MVSQVRAAALPIQACLRRLVQKLKRFAVILYVLLFIAILYWRSPSLFRDPRFWADEASHYYTACKALVVCFKVHHLASYQVFANVFVYLAEKVPILWAPAVTTYLSLILHIVVIAQIVQFARACDLSRIVTILMVTAAAIVPQMIEVALTATNAQWVAGVSMLFVFVMPSEWLRRYWRGLAVWCAICGLSGVPATITGPVFGIRALVERSRPILILAAALGAGAALQFILLMKFEAGSLRSYPHDPIVLGMPLILQTVLAPLFSADFATALGEVIAGQRGAKGTTLLGTIVAGLGLVAIIFAAARSGLRGSLVSWTLFAWILVTVVQTFGAIAPELNLSGWVNARYYFFGSMCLVVMLAWGSKARNFVLRAIALGLLGSITVSGIATSRMSGWSQFFLNGQSWSEQINACPVGITCRVVLWPKAWTVDIIK
jgi:hypothetical protein